MITVLWPCERPQVWISSTWEDHVARPGYNRAYAGIDLAGQEQPLRASQLYGGKVLQAMWSTQGYGYTVFIEYAGILRTRTAHMKNLAVGIGQIVGPYTYLGTMDSTGNSTGTHVHWEVWLNRNGTWVNIDPLNAVNGIQVVNDPAMLIPLDGSEDTMPGEYEIPEFPQLVNVTPTQLIAGWINLRALPKTTSSVILGKVKSGETWEAFGSATDSLGNIWYGLRKNDQVGWAAAYYGGQKWLKEA